MIGVALAAAADGEPVYVMTHGYALVTDSGSGVTAGNNLAVAGTTGTAKTAAPRAGPTLFCVGTALTTTAASGLHPHARAALRSRADRPPTPEETTTP